MKIKYRICRLYSYINKKTFSSNSSNKNIYDQELYAFNKENSYIKYTKLEYTDEKCRINNQSIYRKQYYLNSMNYLLKSFTSIKKDIKNILYIGHNPYEFISEISKCKFI